MTALDVQLQSIRSAFQGVIPSPIATASASGEPHSTYLSIVWYVDEERIALSNQFMGTTLANMRENPQVVVRVIDPATMTEYEIRAVHLRSETSGPTFEAMRTQLGAVAEQSGMQDVLRLRSAEVLRVTECAPTVVGDSADASVVSSSGAVDPLSGLEVFGRRMAACRDLDEVTRVGLESLEDLFGIDHSMLLLTDVAQDTLFVVATNGYRPSGVGAEVPLAEGIIGTAARRHRQIAVGNLQRSRTLAAAIVDNVSEIPLPGLPDAQSILVTPLVVQDRLVGVLYLDSAESGGFGPERARLVDVVAGNLAFAVALLDGRGAEDDDADTSPIDAAVPTTSAPALAAVFHERDGSFFLDGDYLIKGVPGRILFALLVEHDASGRSDFSNRELRLNRSIGLPAGKDNLESRLLTLRRRLEERGGPIHLERVGRGRLHLVVDHPLTLTRRDD